MDIFSHGLWAAAAFKGVNVSHPKRKKFKVWLGALFGVIPDLLSFGPITIYMFLRGTGREENFIESYNLLPEFLRSYAEISYNFTHSLIIFFAVFAITSRLIKRPNYIILGWLLHILVDIPTHTLKFYPTPFLFPLSDYKFDGISWGTPWFAILNYSLLALVFTAIFVANLKKPKKKT